MSEQIPDDFMKLAGKAGGQARSKALSSARKSEIASKAARARWANTVPMTNYTGKLRIGDRDLDCAVLDDGIRLISQGDILRALGRAESMGRRSDVAPFLSAANLREYISKDLLEELTPIEYRQQDNTPIKTGYPAAVLPAVCEVYLSAREDGALAKSQLPAAQAAETLMRGLARVGIDALVDEATGYQEVRGRDELQRLLASYVDEAFRPWVRRFPDEFFTQVFRIYDLEKPEGGRRPQFIGGFISEYIYGGLPDGVLEELRNVNPTNASGNRARRHHQHLTEVTGHTHLDRQIASVITLMTISESKDQFKALYAKRFPPKRERVLTVVATEDGPPMTQLELEIP